MDNEKQNRNRVLTQGAQMAEWVSPLQKFKTLDDGNVVMDRSFVRPTDVEVLAVKVRKYARKQGR